MAYDIGPRIGVTGEADFRKSIRDINSELRTLKSEMGVVDSQFSKNEKSEESLTEKNKVLNKQIEAQQKLLKEQTAMLDKCADKYGATDAKTQQWQNTVNLSKTRLNDLNRDLKTNEDALKVYGSSWNTVRENVDKASEKLTTAGEKLESTGKGLTTSLTLPIVALGTAVTASFINLEDGMAKVNTIANVSQDELSKLSDGILEISDNTNTAKDDLTEGFYQALSSGVEVVGDGSSALEFMNENAKLAKAGFSDLSTTVDLTTTIINAYGMSQEDITHISDVLIQTQNLGKTTVAELGSAYGKLIPIAKTMNVSYEASSAAMATLTKNGIATAESTTYLRSMLSELGKDGSTVSDIIEEKTGQSFTNLMASGYSLSDALLLVQQSADEQGTSINNLFSSQEAAIAATTLLTDSGNEYNDCLAQMQDATGKTDAAFKTISDTTGEKMKSAFNKLTNAGTEFGDSIAPMLESFADIVSEAADRVDDLTDSQKDWIVKSLAVTAAIGPVILVVGKLTSGLGSALKAVSSFSAAMVVVKTGVSSATPGINTLAGAIKGLTSPVGLAVIGITATVAGLSALSEATDKNLPKIREQKKAWDEYKQSINDTTDAVKSSIEQSDANIKSSEAQIDVAQGLADKIFELADNQNRSAAETSTMNSMIQEFNSIIPDANLAVDSNTGSLNLNRDAIQECIDKRREQIRIEALNDELVANQKEQIEVADKLNDANTTRNDLVKEYQEKMDAIDTSKYTDAEQRKIDLSKEYKEKLEDADKAVQDLQSTQDDLQSKYSEYESFLTDGDAFDTFVGNNQDAQQSVEDFSGSATDAAKEIEDSFEKKLSEAGTNGSQGLKSGLNNGIPDVSQASSNLFSAVLSVFQPWLPTWNQLGFGAGTSTASGMDKSRPEASTSSEGLKQAILTPFGTIGNDGNVFGLSFGTNVGTGIGSTKGNVQRNSQDTKDAAITLWNDMGSRGGGIGVQFGTGVGTGIGSTKGSVNSTSTDLKQTSVLSPFSGIGGSGSSIGGYFGDGINTGMQNKKSALSDTSDNLVQLLIGQFHKGLGIHSPATEGVYIGENWVQGMINGMGNKDLLSFVNSTISGLLSAFNGGTLDIQTLMSAMGDDIATIFQKMGIGGGSGNWPVVGEITSYFGNRDAPTSGASTYHEGIDIAAALGTAVSAFNSGVVQFAGSAGGYGNQVIIDHLNGLVTYYSHLNDIMVSAGQTVSAGQQIGTVGSTGISTGPHLDFRTEQNGQFVDPLIYLNGSSSSSTTSGGDLTSWISQALAITGMYNSQNLANTISLAQGESGGNPAAINLWDSNAAAGHPSKGLMQMIDSTFNAYKLDGYDNIWDPVSNAIASIRYQMSRYGYLRATPGYAVGTRYVPRDMLAVVHQGEFIAPASQNPYSDSGGDYFEALVERVVDKMNGVAGATINNYYNTRTLEPSEITRSQKNILRKLK